MFSSSELRIWDKSKESPGLIQLVREGRLVVPRFQRAYVWKQRQAMSLIHSIARGWPAGTILLTLNSTEFPHTSLKYVEEHTPDVKYAILDGQQRLTALNAIYFGRIKGNTHFIDLHSMLRRRNRDPLEEDFRVLSNGKFQEEYGEEEGSAAQSGIITVPAIINDTTFNAWLEWVPSDELKEEYANLREERLGGLENYRFPVQVIDADAPIEVLTNIFVTINRQGQPLEAFDLMVAKTWLSIDDNPPDGYNMRAIWTGMASGKDDESTPTNPRLENYQIHPTTPLKVCQVVIQGPDASVTNGRILDLAPDEVRKRFKEACLALDKTLSILEDKVGLVPETLPSENYLVPIASAIFQRIDSVEVDSDLCDRIAEWYWAATFSQRYGKGGTNSKLAPDSKELEVWLASGDDSDLPSQIKDFWTDPRSGFQVRDLVDVVNMNEHLMKALLTLQIWEGAVDWAPTDGDPIAIKASGRRRRGGSTSPTSILQNHHIFPVNNPLPGREETEIEVAVPDFLLSGDTEKLALSLLSKEEADIAAGIENEDGKDVDGAVELVINRALILAATNANLTDKAPSSIFESGDAVQDLVETNLVPADKETLGNWPRFVETRIERIVNALSSRVRSPLG